MALHVILHNFQYFHQAILDSTFNSELIEVNSQFLKRLVPLSQKISQRKENGFSSVIYIHGFCLHWFELLILKRIHKSLIIKVFFWGGDLYPLANKKFGIPGTEYLLPETRRAVKAMFLCQLFTRDLLNFISAYRSFRAIARFAIYNLKQLTKKLPFYYYLHFFSIDYYCGFEWEFENIFRLVYPCCRAKFESYSYNTLKNKISYNAPSSKSLHRENFPGIAYFNTIIFSHSTTVTCNHFDAIPVINNVLASFSGKILFFLSYGGDRLYIRQFREHILNLRMKNILLIDNFMPYEELDSYLGDRSLFVSLAMRNEALTLIRRHIILGGSMLAYKSSANYNILSSEYPANIFTLDSIYTA